MAGDQASGERALFAALVDAAQDEDLDDVVAASIGLLASAVIRLAQHEGWDQQTAFQKADVCAAALRASIDRNWAKLQTHS